MMREKKVAERTDGFGVGLDLIEKEYGLGHLNAGVVQDLQGLDDLFRVVRGKELRQCIGLFKIHLDQGQIIALAEEADQGRFAAARPLWLHILVISSTPSCT